MDRLALVHHLIVETNCRDIIDNVADMAHFFYIHSVLPTYFKNIFEGTSRTQYLHNVGRPDLGDMGTSSAKRTWIRRPPTSGRRS